MPSRRQGFTLIELLVVITIIIILMSLLLPAIHKGLELGRRVSCANNIRQLGLAVTSYETQNGVYPAAGVVDDSNDLRSGKMLSWIVLVLPQMDQQPLFDQFDMQRTVFDQPNDPQSVSIPALMCPSDNARDKYLVDSALTNNRRCAKGNYAAYCSPTHTDHSRRFPAPWSWGARRSSRTSVTGYPIRFA